MYRHVHVFPNKQSHFKVLNHFFPGMDLEIDAELEKAKKVSKDLTGPVYDVEAVNHFKEVVLHAEAIRNLQGPVYEADR